MQNCKLFYDSFTGGERSMSNIVTMDLLISLKKMLETIRKKLNSSGLIHTINILTFIQETIYLFILNFLSLFFFIVILTFELNVL